ncbi:MAG: fimbrial protein [Chania sp.]
MNISICYKKLLYAMVLIIASLLPQHSALAACNFTNGNGLQSYAINLNSALVIADNISLARDQFPPGAVIASGEAANSVSGNYATCNGSNPYSYYVSGSTGTTVGGLNNVFPTNIPGIGLRFYSRDNSGKNYRFGNQGTGGSSSSISWGWNQSGNTFWGVDVVVTGPVSSGTYNGGLMAVFTLGSLTVLNARVAPFSVTASSCSAATTQSIVDFGTHNKKEFPTQGSVAGKTNFTIELTGCSTSSLSTVAYTLTPINSIINANQGVMGVNAMPGAATGIGIQIMNQSGAPVSFNTVTNVPSFVSGSQVVSIPFQAALYRTSSTLIAPGLVRAPLTFTMTYR